ncbi:M23 family metallopeptidase [Candidatus Uhrbacteria bacterium]|jgi:hypothetical protein|nr:M23 family metallopeptidase [Candidatus Uhrbacteria bacterium]
MSWLVLFLISCIYTASAKPELTYRCEDQSGSYRGASYCRAVRSDYMKERVIYGSRESVEWDKVVIVGLFNGNLRYRGYVCDVSFYIEYGCEEKILNKPNPLQNASCTNHPLVGDFFRRSVDPLPTAKNLLHYSSLRGKVQKNAKSWMWPTDWCVVTQSYHPGDHTGIDIDGNARTRTYAAQAGVVIFGGWKGGYGKTIEIRHENGYVTRYAHHSRISVYKGQQVNKGQIIGVTGATGNVRGQYGTHLHVEVIYNGRHQDPETYLSCQR